MMDIQTRAFQSKSVLPKVLLVDDEPRVLRSLKAVLKTKYQVLTAEKTQQAQNIMIREKDISVLISDERMPEQFGHELLIWAKEKFPVCSRILMTGHFDSCALQNSINEAEIFRYLTKPWDWGELKKVIDNAVLLNQAKLKFSDVKQQGVKKKRKCSIAVLDINIDKRCVYEQLAKSEKLEVIFFNSFNELMNGLAVNRDIGVVFVDTDIGYKDSIESVSQINEIYSGVVIIIVTTAAAGAEAVTMLNQGQIFKYLVKPLTITRLKPMLFASVAKFNLQRNENEVILNQLKNSKGDHNASYFWNKILHLWSHN